MLLNKLFVNKPSQSKINKVNAPTLLLGMIVAIAQVWGFMSPDMVAKINQTLVILAPLITIILRTFFTTPQYPDWMQRVIERHGNTPEAPDVIRPHPRDQIY